MPLTSPISVEEIRPQVALFYRCLFGAGIVAAMLIGLAMRFPAAWTGEKLWTAGSFFVTMSTVERLYFDVKRIANTHNRAIDPQVFSEFSFTLALERLVGQLWVFGSILLYLDHWLPKV